MEIVTIACIRTLQELKKTFYINFLGQCLPWCKCMTKYSTHSIPAAFFPPNGCRTYYESGANSDLQTLISLLSLSFCLFLECHTVWFQWYDFIPNLQTPENVWRGHCWLPTYQPFPYPLLLSKFWVCFDIYPPTFSEKVDPFPIASTEEVG